MKSESGAFTAEDLEPYSLYTPELSNPVTGPVYIEGITKGDGELSGITNEIRSAVRLMVETVSRKPIPHPRIETERKLVCFCSAKPLEGTIENATGYMHRWIEEEYDLNPRSAYILFSICPDFRIDVYQMVRMPGISYTAAVRFPKSYLKRRRRKHRVREGPDRGRGTGSTVSCTGFSGSP